MANDDVSTALAALIQQVTTLTEKVEANEKRYDDVYRVNGKLLEQLKGPKPADPPKDDMAALSQSMQALADTLAKPAPDTTQHRKEGDPVTIGRSAALDPRQYEAAKEQARDLGVPLELIDDRPSAQTERPVGYTQRDVDTSLIDHVDDTGARVRYVRHDVAMGGAGLVQNS
ncbi:MAG: hypothetical protein AAF742_00045 [Pseudomonadota bacterium]